MAPNRDMYGGSTFPPRLFNNILLQEYIMILMKPYDNQLAMRDTVHIDIERYYHGNNNMPSVSMLIGFTKTQKDSWLKRYSDEEDIIINSHDISSWYGRKIQKRKLFKQIKLSVENGARGPSIILTGDNFLTRKDRSIFLDFFSDYTKCAIVWEKELEKMHQVGYERPTVSEGFDDFTYHIS